MPGCETSSSTITSRPDSPLPPAVPDSRPPAAVNGRNTPTEPTSRISASSRPSATADLPVRPSGDATYTLRLTAAGYRSHRRKVRVAIGYGTGANACLATFLASIFEPMISAPPQIPGLAEWRPLAQGGFSIVWQARQESLNRLVAVKVDQRKLTSETERRRFLREAGAAGRLSGHPGIVTVHDAGILEDDQPYLVMELCPGGSLSKWLKPENRKSQDRVRDVGVRIADALATAHARGVLHRDVKPANILINAYDHPGLADFGLAAVPEPGSEIAATLEALTPAYAPREVIYGEAPTEASDVYSLAATLYALLCGKAPRYPEGRQPTLL